MLRACADLYGPQPICAGARQGTHEAFRQPEWLQILADRVSSNLQQLGLPQEDLYKLFYTVYFPSFSRVLLSGEHSPSSRCYQSLLCGLDLTLGEVLCQVPSHRQVDMALRPPELG